MEKTVENKPEPAQPAVAPEQPPAPAQTHAPAKNGRSGLLKPYMMDIAGGITAITAAIVAGHKSINNKFFASANRNKMFADENKEWQKDLRELNRAKKGQHAGDPVKIVKKKPEIVKGKPKLPRTLKYSFLEREEYVVKKAEIDNAWYKAITTKLDERGINTMRFKFRTLSPHQKTEVGLAAFAVAAVAVGGFLNLASSLRLSKKQSELKDRIAALEKNSHTPQ